MKRWILGSTAILAAVWVASLPDGTLTSGLTFFAFRRQFMFASGFVAYLMMAAAMVLALRSSWLERQVGGLDRMYRLHKWMGIGAGSIIFVHWAMATVPKWLVGAGLLVRPPKPAGAVKAVGFDWIHFAEGVGEWAGYAAMLLIAIALLKKIPYHWFQRSHRFFALVFLAITFHSVVLVPVEMWLTPAGLLAAAAALAGSGAAVYALLGRIGGARRHRGRVRGTERLPGGLMEVSCTLDSPLAHHPGQFAFARFEGARNAHPFSMSSASTSGNEVRFCIKALGDDTRNFTETLREGDAVTIEGPYGHFNFARDERTPHEVWVAGGVGVTPFLARLEHLAAANASSAVPKTAPIEFYYCSQEDNALLQRVTGLCRQAGVKLHVFDQTRHGPLTLDRVLQNAGTPTRARLWFCGPAGLGDALQNAWRTMGLPLRQFHREYFEMR